MAEQRAQKRVKVNINQDERAKRDQKLFEAVAGHLDMYARGRTLTGKQRYPSNGYILNGGKRVPQVDEELEMVRGALSFFETDLEPEEGILVDKMAPTTKSGHIIQWWIYQVQPWDDNRYYGILHIDDAPYDDHRTPVKLLNATEVQRSYIGTTGEQQYQWYFPEAEKDMEQKVQKLVGGIIVITGLVIGAVVLSAIFGKR